MSALREVRPAHGMKFSFPMKEGLQPRQMDDKFKLFIYDEFATCYLEQIGVEPTKANITALREKHKISPDDLELTPN